MNKCTWRCLANHHHPLLSFNTFILSFLREVTEMFSILLKLNNKALPIFSIYVITMMTTVSDGTVEVTLIHHRMSVCS